jgi:hypothetical protein
MKDPCRCVWVFFCCHFLLLKGWYNLIVTFEGTPMPDSQKFFCSDLAWEHGLSLIGTATRGDIWFLLEFTGRWEAKAFEESTLPQKIKDHLNAAPQPGINVRTLLIRQDRSRAHQGYRFFIGQTHPLEPRLYEYHLEDYADILDIDLSQMVLGQPGDPAHLRADPLYLVCTNGKRDQCYSVYGPETYQAMAAEAGEAVWQSSHIGGHNQAPITLFLSHGVNYGHTTPSEARRLIRAYQQGRIVLHHYRGRVCLDLPAQAAEHFWREQTGNLSLPGLSIEAVTEVGENEWDITVCDLEGQDRVQMQIQRRASDYEIPITCSKKKSAPVRSFHRID